MIHVTHGQPDGGGWWQIRCHTVQYVSGTVHTDQHAVLFG
jgi:hypothetical protein